MKIYKVERTSKCGYDEYDACIVVAESREDAKTITPDESSEDSGWNAYSYWKPSVLAVTHIGEASKTMERGVVLASFNAG